MRLLILFLREPLPGQVKTRLGRSVGSERAAIIYRAMVRILLQQLSGLERCHLRIAYSPDDAEEAVRLARLAVAAGLPKWVKLEIHPDPRYLLPDPVETLAAAEQLVQEGFTVLPYINADPVIAKRLQEVGCATVMPLGAPIGSNGGLQTRDQIRIILDQATVPVVVDAGIGAPSHAAEAMELGADAVLVNTAIAVNDEPCRMARAFAQAVEAGRMAYEIGLGATHATAQATSPLTAFLDE